MEGGGGLPGKEGDGAVHPPFTSSFSGKGTSSGRWEGTWRSYPEWSKGRTTSTSIDARTGIKFCEDAGNIATKKDLCEKHVSVVCSFFSHLDQRYAGRIGSFLASVSPVSG